MCSQGDANYQISSFYTFIQVYTCLYSKISSFALLYRCIHVFIVRSVATIHYAFKEFILRWHLKALVNNIID